MHVIALTGSVAAGKSSVSALFRDWGATVIDADRIVRELQQPGEPVFDAIIAAFGPQLVASTGQLDRGQLRRLMLADPAARKRLEGIVHPAVERRRAELLAAAETRGDPLVIVDIPLLFEAADPGAYAGVIVVDAPVAERVRRLTHDRRLDEAEARALIDAQLPPAAKRARATWIIDNDGDRELLAERARDVWRVLPR